MKSTDGRRIGILTLLPVFLLMTAGVCAAAAVSAVVLAWAAKPSFADTLQMKATANSINAFGVDLYGKLRSPEGNLVFSPYSISTALSIAYVGARGKTQSQMAKALHLNLSPAKAGKAFAEVTSRILSARKDGAVEINAANALWADKPYPFSKEYLESVRVYSEPRNWFLRLFGQGVCRQVDFKHNADASRQTINKWVEEQTRHKIVDLLAPSAVNSLTRLVITNAIYFHGKWEKQFNKKLTKPDTFALLNGTTRKVPMMHQEASFGYAEDPGLQVLEMQYRGQDLSMLVLLPSKKRRLEDFEQSITPDKLDRWTRSLDWRKVKVFLPRFRMTCQFDLKSSLRKLGMTDLSDFSGMTGNRELFLSTALHKVLVDTNEEGTEAAAATAVIAEMIGRHKEQPPVPIFRADHPFVFLIRHKPSNCILFFGRVTDPHGN